MKLLFVPIFAIAMLNIVLFRGLWLEDQKKHIINDTLEANTTVSPNTYTFRQHHNKTYTYNIARMSASKAKLDKETVQKIMIRTCNAVYQKALWNNCPNAQNADTVWGFAKNINIRGDLYPAWNGANTPTFSCGSEAEYGRYLLRQALPISVAREYGYDLNSISDYDADGGERMYPCGYSEIVYKL